MFLPTLGISLKGENSKGPKPYPSTYIDNPRDALGMPTPNLSMTADVSRRYHVYL